MQIHCGPGLSLLLLHDELWSNKYGILSNSGERWLSYMCEMGNIFVVLPTQLQASNHKKLLYFVQPSKDNLKTITPQKEVYKHFIVHFTRSINSPLTAYKLGPDIEPKCPGGICSDMPIDIRENDVR